MHDCLYVRHTAPRVRRRVPAPSPLPALTPCPPHPTPGLPPLHPPPTPLPPPCPPQSLLTSFQALVNNTVDASTWTVKVRGKNTPVSQAGRGWRGRVCGSVGWLGCVVPLLAVHSPALLAVLACGVTLKRLWLP